MEETFEIFYRDIFTQVKELGRRDLWWDLLQCLSLLKLFRMHYIWKVMLRLDIRWTYIVKHIRLIQSLDFFENLLARYWYILCKVNQKTCHAWPSPIHFNGKNVLHSLHRPAKSSIETFSFNFTFQSLTIWWTSIGSSKVSRAYIILIKEVTLF